ncbi:MAG: ABC transporter ATP-binding protein [Gammaproteobacteria bacterium]|nr:ABC transporter ATP-binding protein [Gammaproteobacteria bacterium]
MSALLKVQDLDVRFDTRDGVVRALNNVSFSLQAGEVLGLLGESGSGKSVTLRAIARLLPRVRCRESGRIDFDGICLSTADRQTLGRIRGPRVAMVFQEPMIALDPVFTIGTQIAETIVKHEGLSWHAATARAQQMLDLVRIPSAARRLRSYPHELSGGMRQRAMIALALACKPQLLLADEPTTALDVTVQIQIVLLLRELQRELGMAVIFVTHDVGVAAEIADRIAVMYAGRLVEQGDAVEVLERPGHPYTDGLLHATVHGARRGAPLQAIEGMPPDLTQLGPGCPFAPRCRRAEPGCEQTLPPFGYASPGHAIACLRPLRSVSDCGTVHGLEHARCDREGSPPPAS